MILAYAIKPQDNASLLVEPLMAEIKPGRPLGKVVYPVHAEALLKATPSNLSLSAKDRRILMQLVMHQSAQGRDILFSGRAAADVLEDLVGTGRCYLWDQREAPLAKVDPFEAAPIWEVGEEGLTPGFDLPLQAVVIPSSPPYVLHRGALSVSALAAGSLGAAAAAWLSGGGMSPAEARAFSERMRREFSGAEIPDPPAE